MFKKISENYLFYVPLVFLIFPIVGMVSFGYPVWYSLPTALFTVSYISVVHSERAILIACHWFYMVAYVGLSTFFINGNMYWFIFYLSNLIVYRFNDNLMRSYRAWSLHVLVILTHGVVLFLQHVELENKLFAVLVTVLCYAFLIFNSRTYNENLLHEQVRQQNQQINFLLAENERNRISQDLHDTLGHVFASLSIQSELVVQLLNLNQYDKAKQTSEQVNQLAKKALFDVRQIIQNLKQHTIQDELELMRSLLRVTNVTLQIHQDDAFKQLTPSEQSHVAMMIRELTNNLIKHAKASTCRLDMQVDNKVYQLVYEDNGVGFQNMTEKTLHSIKERADLMRAQVEIVSPKNPTKIIIEWIKEE